MGDNNNCVATVTTTIVKASRGEDPLVPVSGAMLVKERQGMAVEVQDPPPRPAMGGSIEGGKGVLRRGGNGFWGSDDDIGLCRRRRQYEWELRTVVVLLYSQITTAIASNYFDSL
ncbi:Os04g0331300 [Oryza sativa Japonica Group]|uniref:Os04g0331300 protein n=1 Tax=Oryza sativa subsp. japonica TaxID=39947 RepID=A0A0P0W8K3_ORYSJ|nr:Os04g0331300 [Oryza sativa Japonica Group]